MVFNPRSMSKPHMLENLAVKLSKVTLDAAELKVLQSFEPDACSAGT